MQSTSTVVAVVVLAMLGQHMDLVVAQVPNTMCCNRHTSDFMKYTLAGVEYSGCADFYE